MSDVSILLGLTLTKIEFSNIDSEMHLETADGRKFRFFHNQDCCENVYIEDITGDTQDLIGNPLLLVEEVSNSDPVPYAGSDSYTWTFYKFSTIKGSVTIRWLGESNGYYSERVDFSEYGLEGD